jgi:hypothetical protein
MSSSSTPASISVRRIAATIADGLPGNRSPLRRGQVGAHKLISHRFALGDWNKALEIVKNKEGVKVILKPNSQ